MSQRRCEGAAEKKK